MINTPIIEKYEITKNIKYLKAELNNNLLLIWIALIKFQIIDMVFQENLKRVSLLLKIY